MPDRTIAPEAAPRQSITVPELEKRNLSNGIPLFILNNGTQDVAKVEITLKAGVKYEKKPGVSFLTGKLLTSGTHRLNSEEIATQLDYYGAFFEVTSGFDHITVSLYFLNKFREPVLQLAHELFTDSSFPEEELNLAKRLKKNDIRLSNQKDNLFSAKLIRRNIFGTEHAYGKILTEELLEDVSREDILEFYHNQLFNDPLVIASGKIDRDTAESIEDCFRKLTVKQYSGKQSELVTHKKKEVVVREESMQSSLRLARITIDKKHPDVHKLQAAVGLLGGYFGSRLMRNIREDKGYTYGVGASVAHLQEASFILISTDVIKEHTVATIREIQLEINRLQQEPVSEDELSVLTSYLRGKFLLGLDSPFNIAAKFKAVHLYGLDYDYYRKFISTMDNLTPGDIMEVSQKYLNYEDFCQVIVGGEL